MSILKKGNKQKQERKQGTKEKKDKRKKKTGNEKHLQSARHILQRTAKNVSSNRPSFSFSSAFLYLFLSCFVFPFFWSSQCSPEGSETSLNPVWNTEKHPLRMNPSIEWVFPSFPSSFPLCSFHLHCFSSLLRLNQILGSFILEIPNRCKEKVPDHPIQNTP